jgi:hypothetical protein
MKVSWFGRMCYLLFAMSVGLACSSKQSNFHKVAKPPTPVPESLQTDAYHYYGLSNLSHKNYRITIRKGSQVSSLEESVSLQLGGRYLNCPITLIESTTVPGVGKYTVRLSVEEDGLYIAGYDTPNGPVDTGRPFHCLQLPAELNRGAKWKSEQVDGVGGQSFGYNLACEVLGSESIETWFGSRVALRIHGAGNGELAGHPAKLTVESWYVRDVGLVKQSVVAKTANGETTITQELVR